MRKLPAALAVAALAAVSLTGCTSSPSADDCVPESADVAALDLVNVTGSVDAVPNIDLYTPFHVEQTEFREDVAGEGTEVEASSQLIVVDVALFSGETGDALLATPYDGDLSRAYTVDRWAEQFPAFTDALVCASPGSRVTIAMAPGDYDAASLASVGVAEDDTVIAVVDVRKVYLSAADGDNQFNVGHGLPTVVRAPDGRPGIIVPDGAAPDGLQIETLKKGDGAVVTGEQPVRVHYTGVTWDEREVFDTSWDSEPASMTLDAVVPGFAAALDGQTVGSQVLVVIPPEQGYGDQAQGSIPAGSTLVFVIDILGLDDAPLS
ncbi:FKBP-type peptidyl-prolyl cis-trans isomerase [Microbacterium sp. C7(2022)]|uniref:FKBP-type peptidyl-prolyl cis-trans isomerase n=1 Tax=Microbacterium sp. C7(2022) TaxID=2992759 RepID=UPI00237A520A|nr:FKBP-type peptidyl-prolyl cis-trans isomerase [Microbacterium sp. C7(2022)]MDE0545598.1 FKBP-type peptidyl-prolyl cis-trans isomerase [Microbacterium sp. C7(2022)]